MPDSEDTARIVASRKVVLIRIDRRIVVAILMCFLSCVLMCVMTFVFTVRVAREGVHNFCDLLGTYDQVYREHPPTTETGRTLAQQIHELVERLECSTP